MSIFSRRHFCALSGAATIQVLGTKHSPGLTATFSTTNSHYTNPIIPGDHPDAGAIRVGNHYYLTHTSFRYTPGLVIWKSSNLIDWKPVCAALRRYIGDVWAPYLCEHDGRYFIYFPVDGKLFVVQAANPEGPWSEPIDLHLHGIDPAHLGAADGKRYLYIAGGQMIELSSDGLATAGTLQRTFSAWRIPDNWSVQCECLEAPKIFEKDGYYYLTVAEGGTSGPPTSHMVISMRSKSPIGPWEFSPHNPILHAERRTDFWWSVGHGRLVEAADKSWWMTCHAYENGYRSLGRQNLLVPVEWTKSGWFRVAADISSNRPLPIQTDVRGEKHDFSDDFLDDRLRPQWQFFRGYDLGRVSIGSGILTLAADGTSAFDTSVMACMAGNRSYTVEVDVETERGCEAGLILFYDPMHSLGLTVGTDGLGLLRNGAHRHSGVKADRATLRIVNDQQTVSMYYRLPGGQWAHLREAFDISEYNDNSFGGFLDLRPALFAAVEGNAHFRAFRHTPFAIVPNG